MNAHTRPFCRRIRAAAFLAAAALFSAVAPIPARADETSRAANALALEQAIDCLSTLSSLRLGGREGDPLAKPFVRSPMVQFGSAIAMNLAMRHVSIRVLHTVVELYPFVLLGNARAMAASGSMAGQVRFTGQVRR